MTMKRWVGLPVADMPEGQGVPLRMVNPEGEWGYAAFAFRRLNADESVALYEFVGYLPDEETSHAWLDGNAGRFVDLGVFGLAQDSAPTSETVEEVAVPDEKRETTRFGRVWANVVMAVLTVAVSALLLVGVAAVCRALLAWAGFIN